MTAQPLLPSLSQLGQPLQDAIFLERPQRFMLRVWLPEEEEEKLVHLGDPGRLTHLLTPGTLLKIDGPFPTTKRKTAYTAILAKASTGAWVSLVTQLPNRLFSPLLFGGYLPELWHPPLVPPSLKQEVKYGQSRIDATLQFGKQTLATYIECKSVTWASGNIGLFPDAPTKRGQKHIRELLKLQKMGHQTGILLIAGREDIETIQPAKQIDPEFAELFKKAKKEGIQLLGISLSFTDQQVFFGKKIPILI